MAPCRSWLLPVPLLVLVALLIMSWFHWLPGGWFLRNLLEAPAHRAERLRLDHRKERLAEFGRQDGAQEPGQVVFLGSSTIEFFPLDACFPGKHVINRGIGEELIRELAMRLQLSLPAKPASVVIYSGAVDLHARETAPAALGALMRDLLQELARQIPLSPVCVLGLLPIRDMSGTQVTHLSRANAALCQAAEAQGQTFLDTTRSPLVTASGGLARDHSRDAAHLNRRGYAVLARWLREHGGPATRPLR